jgi:hypothetical protein
VVNPILDLRQNLSSTSNAPVLSYTTTATSPQPIRIVTDSVFDGHTWLPETGRVPGDQRVQDGLPTPPGLSSAVSASQVSTTITIGSLNETYLPLPYPTRRVRIAGSWLYDARTLNVVRGTRRTTTIGASYDVEHLDVQPTSEQLQDAGAAPTSITENYLALPDLPPSVRETAQRVAGTGSRYDQAVRLQQFFRSSGGFVYSTEAPRSDNARTTRASGRSPRSCSPAAALRALRLRDGRMARSLGIPRPGRGRLPPGDGRAGRQPRGAASATPRLAGAVLRGHRLGALRADARRAVGTVPAWTLAPLDTPGASAPAVPSAGASVPAVSPRRNCPPPPPPPARRRG